MKIFVYRRSRMDGFWMEVLARALEPFVSGAFYAALVINFLLCAGLVALTGMTPGTEIVMIGVSTVGGWAWARD